jgi:hypothetical protein
MLLVRATATEPRGNWPAGGALRSAGVGFDAGAALEHVLRVRHAAGDAAPDLT